jgi:acetylornithine deacetylase/succinyl-diaminopimelate desuccinylase-like protein
MEYLDFLTDFLSIPSISTLPEHLSDMARCRQFISEFLQKLGFSVQELPGVKHPAIFAELITQPSNPTVLIYGHYDVQPADPIESWITPPFTPTIKGDKLYARGATDDKGQIAVHLLAAKQLIEKFGRNLPINFKFYIEGEEEIGSNSITDHVQKYSQLLQADYLIVSDTEMPEVGTPAIHVSLRGLVYTEIRLTTADHDLHSGQFGGVAPNPAIWLAALITKLKAEGNKILIPHFYDDVINPTPEELSDFKILEPTEATIMSEGSQYWVGGGEREYLLNERRWSRPTLDVNGFLSGFTGEGSKTIIPNTAMAKISMRLVPNQNPSKIFANFKSYVESLAPKHAKLEVIHHADCLPYKAPLSHPVFNLAKKCLSEAFQKPTVYFATGGSIGAIPVLTTALNNIPCLMIAVGNADDNLHAPNEFIRIDNISKCLIAMTYFYSNLRQVKK